MSFLFSFFFNTLLLFYFCLSDKCGKNSLFSLALVFFRRESSSSVNKNDRSILKKAREKTPKNNFCYCAYHSHELLFIRFFLALCLSVNKLPDDTVSSESICSRVLSCTSFRKLCVCVCVCILHLTSQGQK
jgi:hypothetical protein